MGLLYLVGYIHKWIPLNYLFMLIVEMLVWKLSVWFYYHQWNSRP